jgi:DNA-binding winged helix-turn-helix (wHTH) protein
LAEGRVEVQGRKLAVNGVIADFDSETLRTASGQSVDLRPQAFAVLRYLAEHAGRLVTKDELMDALWAGRSVTDDNLVQCVHEIRRAFQDTDRLVLKTAPRRGYRLVLPADAAQERAWGECSDRCGRRRPRRTLQGRHRRPPIRQHVFGSRARVFL